jgi:hypothetical protein
MKSLRNIIWAMVAIIGLASVSPALAQSSRLKAAGVATAVAKSPLTVTPDKAWNKAGRPGRLSESWTLDGLTINELTFYGGIVDGKTLFREVDKVNAPLPKFSKTMLAPDIATLLESSYRVALGTSLMQIESIEPATFAGTQGFQFTYSFAVQDEVKRRGIARGAVIGDKLFLVTYEAPRIHYFERDKDSFDKIASSARLAAVKKK